MASTLGLTTSDRAHAGTTYSIRMKLGESFKNRVE